MRDSDLRTLWHEPRPPDAPVRVWRDWALLAAGLLAVVVEGLLRDDVVWRPVALAFGIAMAVLPMWRRTRPLAVVLLGFGAAVVLEVVSLAAARPQEQVGLYTTGPVLLLLAYALARWGSGREFVLGSAAILAFFALSAATDDTPAVDQVVGLAFLVVPVLLGASIRFRASAQQRLLDRVRFGERERLARDLHDTVAHHVSAMVIRAQAGRVLARTDPAAAAEALEGVEEEGARTLEDMRSIVATLRDGEAGAELTPAGGVADLERLVRSPGGGSQVNLRLDGKLDELPLAIDAAVFRIVQEALTNTRRHAVDATEVTIQVTGEPQRILITVQDNGARTGRGRTGYGLTGLRERAALLGGSLRAGPGPDRGWRLEAELPRGKADSGDHPRTRR